MAAVWSVTVTNVDKGWAYTAVHGEVDTTKRVHLASPLSLSWGFTDELFPHAALEAWQAKVNLIGQTAGDLPQASVSDRMLVDIRVGTGGARIAHAYYLQVADARITLNDRRRTYKAELALTLTDYSPNWRGREPGEFWNSRVLGKPAGGFRYWWRERFAELAALTGTSVGCPTYWADREHPARGGASGQNGEEVNTLGNVANPGYQGKLADCLVRNANSHQPNNWTHTLVTMWRDDQQFPPGYRYVGPDSWAPVPVPDPKPSPVIPDPGGPIKVVMMPTTRRAGGAVGYPMLFGVVNGLLSVVPRQPNPNDGEALVQLAVDAEWCNLPATARRARDTQIGVVQVDGLGFLQAGQVGTIDVPVSFTNNSSSTIRELPTYLTHGLPITSSPSGGDGFGARPAPYLAAQYHLTPPQADGWAFDGFDIVANRIPPAIAAWLLPRIFPRLPGETDGDGKLTRHLTVYGVDPDRRFPGLPVSGFAVAGELKIDDGEMTFSVRTIPGAPIYNDGVTPTEVTVGEFTAAAYSLTTAYNVDSNIRVLDLSIIDGS